jgi:hypothetical protein
MSVIDPSISLIGRKSLKIGIIISGKKEIYIVDPNQKTTINMLTTGISDKIKNPKINQ